MVVSTAEFKKGLKIQFDGAPYTIVDFQHVKPGKGGAFVRTKLKHMKLGRVIDNTFRAGEKVELVDFEEKRMQYLYKDDRYHFMDLDTYDQISLSAEEVGDARDFLKENTEVEILFIDASPVTVELPNFIELQIAKTDPGIRGDTASGGSKPATLETARWSGPLFLNEGDVVKVDTRSGEISAACRRRLAWPGGDGPRLHGSRGPQRRQVVELAVRHTWRDRGRDRGHPIRSCGSTRRRGRLARRGCARHRRSARAVRRRCDRLDRAPATIEAPMVGTFYRAPKPDAPPFVAEGDVVKEGQVICIGEAMKLMNEIESKVAGRIAKVVVENGQPVEFGQPLFLVDPLR